MVFYFKAFDEYNTEEGGKKMVTTIKLKISYEYKQI